MTHKEIQQKIDKATTLKKAINRWVEEKDLPVDQRRKVETLDKEILKAGEVYNTIYDKLTRDAKRNKWSINDFNVEEPFDYETFDYDVKFL